MNEDHGADIAAQYDVKRSPHWEATKKAYLLANPHCVACGPAGTGTKYLQVHHREPFHLCILSGRPDLELDWRNLVSLCETQEGMVTQDHHLDLGHLRDFQSYNPQVFEDATGRFHGRTRAEIEADQVFLALLRNRPKTWREMSAADRHAYRLHLDARFPSR